MQKKSILFLECINTPYTSKTLETKPVGGIGMCTALLSQALQRRGHDVCIVNNISDDLVGEYDGIEWHNDVSYGAKKQAHHDIVIANNDATLFSYAQNSLRNGAVPVLWFHNPLSLVKTCRKGRMMPMIRWRPVGVFLGKKHLATANPLYMFRKKLTIPHGLPEYIYEQRTDNIARGQKAIFISQPYRGLREMIALWISFINPVNSEAEFDVICGDVDLKALNIPYTIEQLSRANIILHPKQSHKNLLKKLAQARVMLCPGHRDETYCLAAAEAQALGVPVVTYGIGALSERVQNKKTGRVIENQDERAFAAATLELLNNDNVFCEYAQNAKKSYEKQGWNMISERWETQVFS